jgi:hypothetical protein
MLALVALVLLITLLVALGAGRSRGGQCGIDQGTDFGKERACTI